MVQIVLIIFLHKTCGWIAFIRSVRAYLIIPRKIVLDGLEIEFKEKKTFFRFSFYDEQHFLLAFSSLHHCIASQPSKHGSIGSRC